MPTNLDQSQEFWERHARRDPLWAILTDPSKKGRKWDLPSFFERGEREISLLIYQLQQLGLQPRLRNALDFGCGVGRLTEAMARHFDTVVGIDISPTMVRLAQRLSGFPGRVRYVCNPGADLSIVESGSMDFIYSDVVLQHIEPRATADYLREFARVLVPGGLAVFQLPSEKRSIEAAMASPRPMPDDAYRAELRLDWLAAPSSIGPGESLPLVVTVKNASPRDWSQLEYGAVRAGNHWRNATGTRMLIQDDGRATLPNVLRSGETIVLPLDCTAPGDVGLYVCEADVVHEGVTWFADRGSVAARLDIEVTSGESGREASPEAAVKDGTRSLGVSASERRASYPSIYEALFEETAAPDEFPMHGIPRDQVEDLMRRNSCELMHAELDERCGREWVGYRYFFQKG